MRVAGALLLALAGCAPEHPVDVVISTDGFQCENDDGPLFERTRGPDGRFFMNVTIDFIAVSEATDCRLDFVREVCEAGGCVPIAESSACAEVELLTGGDGLDPEDLIAVLDRHFPSVPTPDGPVIARIYATTLDAPCGAAAIDPAHMVGCVFACTAAIDLEDELTFALGGGLTPCEPLVAACISGVLP